MSLPHFSTSDFDTEVLNNKKPVLVDFYAEWCGPCQLAAPILERLAEEMKDTMVIGKVDVDQNQELSMRYGIMSIPTMILFKDGKILEKKIGFPGEGGIRRMVEALK